MYKVEKNLVLVAMIILSFSFLLAFMCVGVYFLGSTPNTDFIQFCLKMSAYVGGGASIVLVAIGSVKAAISGHQQHKAEWEEDSEEDYSDDEMDTLTQIQNLLERGVEECLWSEDEAFEAISALRPVSWYTDDDCIYEV